MNASPPTARTGTGRVVPVWATTTVLGALICAGGWGCAAPATAPTGEARVGRVYMIRGLFDVFSTGLHDLCGTLTRDHGVETFDGGNLAGDAIAGACIQRRRAGDESPIIVGGHSNGANAAVGVAWDLAEQNIPVELLVLIDDFAPPPVPRNVKKVLVITGRGSLAGVAPPHGIWLDEPVVEHMDIAVVPLPVIDLLLGQLQHFTTDKDARVHARIIDEVTRICPTRAEWAIAVRQRDEMVAAERARTRAIPGEPWTTVSDTRAGAARQSPPSLRPPTDRRDAAPDSLRMSGPPAGATPLAGSTTHRPTASQSPAVPRYSPPQMPAPAPLPERTAPPARPPAYQPAPAPRSAEPRPVDPRRGLHPV